MNSRTQAVEQGLANSLHFFANLLTALFGLK
jgi:hypothetical protein